MSFNLPKQNQEKFSKKIPALKIHNDFTTRGLLGFFCVSFVEIYKSQT